MKELSAQSIAMNLYRLINQAKTSPTTSPALFLIRIHAHPSESRAALLRTPRSFQSTLLHCSDESQAASAKSHARTFAFGQKGSLPEILCPFARDGQGCILRKRSPFICIADAHRRFYLMYPPGGSLAFSFPPRVRSY